MGDIVKAKFGWSGADSKINGESVFSASKHNNKGKWFSGIVKGIGQKVGEVRTYSIEYDDIEYDDKDFEEGVMETLMRSLLENCAKAE